MHIISCIRYFSLLLLYRFKDFCQLAMKTTTNPPSTVFEQGRFTLGNATAIVTLGTTINHASASELCRSNELDLTGAGFSMIHGTGLEEEVYFLDY